MAEYCKGGREVLVAFRFDALQYQSQIEMLCFSALSACLYVRLSGITDIIGLINSLLRYFQYGFLYHAGDNNMIFKDKLKSTQNKIIHD